MLEQEHGAREALLQLYADGDLKFDSTPPDAQKQFLESVAARYVAQSLKQSKEFFRQAEPSSWLVKPLLLYYAMLACAKACLLFYSPDFIKSKAARTHGLSTNNDFRENLDLSKDSVIVRSAGVYPFIRQALGLASLPPDLAIPLEQIVTRIPAVDFWYRTAFGKDTEPEHWFDIRGSILIPDKNGVRVGFNVDADYYKKVEKRIPDVIRKAFQTREFASSNGTQLVGFYQLTSWTTQHAALSLGVPSVISPTGDNAYHVILPFELGGNQYDVSEVELLFLVAFYLSSIARYQPHLWLQLNTGARDFSVLLTQNLLNACENTFLGLVWARLSYTVSLPLLKRPPASVPKTP